MHAAGIEFDDALFIGQTPKSNRVVIRIVFGTHHDADAGIERVPAAFQECVCIFDVVVTVVRADDDRTFGRAFL